ALFTMIYVSSVATAVFLKKHPKGSKIFNRIQNFFHNNFTTKFPSTRAKLVDLDKKIEQASGNAGELEKALEAKAEFEKALDTKSERMGEIFSLSIGGTIPALPFKLIEDRRANIVNAYDRKHGTGIDNPEKEAAAQQRINQTASQTWMSAIASRAAALVVVYATAYMPKVGDGIMNVQKKLGEMLMNNPVGNGIMRGIDKLKLSWFPYKPEVKELAEVSKQNKDFVGDMVVADGIWTVYSTALMLAASRILAPIMGNKIAYNLTGFGDNTVDTTKPERKREPIYTRPLADKMPCEPEKPTKERSPKDCERCPSTKVGSGVVESQLADKSSTLEHA
ncbi:MAG: hypothetical protein MRY32_06660, partial [Rickettsiales bacterium]|nr:hypothetical protein [Rickettsiales bacterium]